MLLFYFLLFCCYFMCISVCHMLAVIRDARRGELDPLEMG